MKKLLNISFIFLTITIICLADNLDNDYYGSWTDNSAIHNIFVQFIKNQNNFDFDLKIFDNSYTVINVNLSTFRRLQNDTWQVLKRKDHLIIFQHCHYSDSHLMYDFVVGGTLNLTIKNLTTGINSTYFLKKIDTWISNYFNGKWIAYEFSDMYFEFSKNNNNFDINIQLSNLNLYLKNATFYSKYKKKDNQYWFKMNGIDLMIYQVKHKCLLYEKTEICFCGITEKQSKVLVEYTFPTSTFIFRLEDINSSLLIHTNNWNELTMYTKLNRSL